MIFPGCQKWLFSWTGRRSIYRGPMSLKKSSRQAERAWSGEACKLWRRAGSGSRFARRPGQGSLPSGLVKVRQGERPASVGRRLWPASARSYAVK